MSGAALVALMALVLLATAGAARAQLPPADVPPAANHTRCGAECLRCAADGCVRCARLLAPGGACARACPAGTRAAWARDGRLSGRVCYPARSYHEVAVGGACGVAACVALVALGAACARCRGAARARAQPLPQRARDDDDTALREFHKQLDCLRPHAYTLLAILNHTRRQVRDLYQLGNSDAAAAYSCILSDLAKLLILLNKQQVPVVPDEWPRLASWADRILKRYSRTAVNPPEEGQLVNFLPSPPDPDARSDSAPQSFSTFKPPSYTPASHDSSIIDKELECDWGDVGRPPSYSQVEKERDRESIVLSDPWERRPIVRRESVWLEDEFFEMTRRPQDELTTEL